MNNWLEDPDLERTESTDIARGVLLALALVGLLYGTLFATIWIVRSFL